MPLSHISDTSSGHGSQTFNAPGTFTVPTGVYSVNLSGYGGKGNPGNPGTAGNPSNSTTTSYAVGNNAENTAQGFDGNIATTAVYNRELSAAEVSTNFNNLRSRFGV
jgi:hypothetical protein